MELADVRDSKSRGGDTVRVRPPPPAPKKKAPKGVLFSLVPWRPSEAARCGGVIRSLPLRSTCGREPTVPPTHAPSLGIAAIPVDFLSGLETSLLPLLIRKAAGAPAKPFRCKVPPLKTDNYGPPLSAPFKKIRLWGKTEIPGTVCRSFHLIPTFQTEFCHYHHLSSMIPSMHCKCNAYLYQRVI